ncbi:PLP-dependent aminotransferase family protein [Streptomyces iconiensis]|uniref:PLP-dependent aminotransferase family protein n=1 Tax=Streptomyces iconiensis TaxID=1384038 RepID=A0ABT7A851_9ACTN|nr:PLP-dependent aminotransferase family protein [Streptomyces iconiensis]MDJ1137504.1 PLP-dependent aminotransferase family protein [Streptomyces iconiensis]
MHRPHDDAPNRSRNQAGSDFLHLDPAEAPARAVTDWLTARLRSALADGTLTVGSTLPATRALAAELGVSRGVVTETYQRLAEDGHLAGRGRRGTVVVAAPPTGQHQTHGQQRQHGQHQQNGQHGQHRRTEPEPAGAVSTSGTADAAGTGTGTTTGTTGSSGPPDSPDSPGPDVFDRLRAVPAAHDLTPGTPDLASFPRAGWLRAERAVLTEAPPSVLGYGDPRGAPALREAVATWLARTRGIRAHPDDVLIVNGTAQALGLLAQMLGGADVREIAVEDPGSLGAVQHLRHWGMTTLPVPVDGEGLRVDALRSCGAGAALLTPAHQFPMGVVLGGARRRALMRWARDGGLVVEDDYDAEQRYDRPPVPALHASLPEQVVHLGSASKLLAPGLRIGWLLAPARYREALVAAKRFADLGTGTLPQLTLAHLMRSGALARHLRGVRRRNRARRDAMVRALAEWSPHAVVHGAAAGLHLTVTLPATVTDTELAATALRNGVKTHPLTWHRHAPGAPGLVLGYAAAAPTATAQAVRSLPRL